jgi:D-galactarolactone cycloisomerase
MSNSFKIRSVQAFCYRYPLSTPVVTSFGRMNDRQAVFVRAEDEDGAHGWGEVWCNFPPAGAEHRARLINGILAPMFAGRSIEHPSEMFDYLTAATSVMALQSGEQGPFAQAIAGVHIALWDSFARRAKEPLWRMLGATSGRMRAYASGINPDGCVATAEKAMQRGHRAFKLKVGFGQERDRTNLRDLRQLIGDHSLAVDVNQGWSIGQALDEAPRLEEFRLLWLEEPLRADRPWNEWRTLRNKVSMPIAGGENIAGRDNFATALTEGVLSVVQPDAAKWGGVTGCFAVAREVLKAKKTYCPHYLGGGIGLLASAHLLAANNGGWLEVDANDNPLRDAFCGPVADVKDGEVELPDTPGLGIEPDLVSIAQYRTLTMLAPRRALRVYIERVDRLARGHEQAVALQASEAEIGAALGQRDAADHDAVGREHHDAVEFGIAHAPAAPQIAVDIGPHAVGRTRTGIDEHALVGDPVAAGCHVIG